MFRRNGLELGSFIFLFGCRPTVTQLLGALDFFQQVILSLDKELVAVGTLLNSIVNTFKAL